MSYCAAAARACEPQRWLASLSPPRVQAAVRQRASEAARAQLGMALLFASLLIGEQAITTIMGADEQTRTFPNRALGTRIHDEGAALQRNPANLPLS